MKPHFLLALTLLAGSAALADTQKAESLVRDNRPADALDALQGDTSPEAAFWRGRALIALGRLQEAAASLQHIPTEHSLYPYAAKGLLYCAWKSNSVDFAVIATPMVTSSNKEIATLATAALAEHWLRQPYSQDNSALERLRQLAREQPELQPVLHLLEIGNLRNRGEFEKAIEQCRLMEADRTLPLIMRQRARLALSSVYYAKEAAEKRERVTARPQKQQGSSAPVANDDQILSTYDDGKGEETLLHFISSHPDSPLLEEAFRRLHENGAFQSSEYAGVKLKEWMAEPLKSRRASLALLIQQHLQTPEGALEITPDVTYANNAAATCPHEPATRTILLEQVRWFLERGQTHEALLYLGMIQGDDVLKHFYENQLHSPDAESTARNYLSCARDASDTLRAPALTNALICALRSGDTATQEAVLNMPDITKEQHYELLLARIAYWLDKDAAKAQADIDFLRSQPAPNMQLQADLEMDQAYLQLRHAPGATRELLQQSSVLNDNLTKLSDERQLRFFALQEEAIRRISGTEDGVDAPREAIDMIQQAAGKVRSPRVVAVLTLHLASLQSSRGQHVEALNTLHMLLRKYPKSDFAERARYMAARESEFIATPDSLKRAAELYELCASRSEELKIKAGIRHAAVLLRLGHLEDSEHILVRLLRNNPDMRPEDKVLANAVLANNKALLGTDEGRAEAINIVGQSLTDATLPTWWRYRVLLHHATLCSRAARHEEALRDYEEVLGMKPATGESPTPADWHILYSAGSGAVMQLLYQKRYAEAAEKADQIAAWNPEKAEPAKRKQFSDWAQYIRQTNFLEASDVLPF